MVAAVSRNGGFGVLGAVELTPEELKVELDWITAHTNGRPFGLDLIVPNKVEGRGEQISDEAMIGRIPDEHREFAASYSMLKGSIPVTSTNAVRAS